MLPGASHVTQTLDLCAAFGMAIFVIAMLAAEADARGRTRGHRVVQVRRILARALTKFPAARRPQRTTRGRGGACWPALGHADQRPGPATVRARSARPPDEFSGAQLKRGWLSVLYGPRGIANLSFGFFWGLSR